MGFKTSILCDCCNEELIVDSQYPHKYSLKLSCIDTGINTSGMHYPVAMKPILKEDMYFCNIKCLTEWLNNRNLKRIQKNQLL